MLSPPCAAPKALQEELEGLQAELQALRCVGAELGEACGDAAAANVSKGMEEVRGDVGLC